MTHSKQHLLLGAHMSIAGGFDKSVERGESIGCTTMQIFTKSNRQWKAKPIDQESATLFKQATKAAGITPLVAHAMYLINLASPESKTRHGAQEAVTTELQRCHELGIDYLVLHPGSRLTSSLEQGLAHIAQGINASLENYTGNTMLLLENMAGQGSGTCARFEEIATIYQAIEQKDKVGVCFDTCHAFAAGYDFRTPETYQALWKEFDDVIGFSKLKAIHLNDSKKELGSRVDRHEDIGKGQLGLEPFRLIMNDERLFAIPKILETPETELLDYKRNMDVLISLLTPETKKILEVL